jgi:hypothetical protein
VGWVDHHPRPGIKRRSAYGHQGATARCKFRSERRARGSIEVAARCEQQIGRQFEQAGNRAQASLQKTGMPQVEYPLRNTPVAKELEGEWKGDYEMLGYPRHVSIKFANHPDGATADFVIVGRKHNVLPVDLVTQEGDLVTVDSHEMGFSFEGRLRNGKLTGAVRQGAIETPLVLVRAK